MNKVVLLVILLIVCGCVNDADVEDRISMLESQNDSLQSIIKDYESKHVYERVFIKHYKTNSEPNAIGNTYKGEFVFVPDVRNDKVQFRAISGVDNIGYDDKKPIILETKSGDFGAYPFEFKITNDTTKIYFNPIIRDSISIKSLNMGYDGTTISDVIIAQ